MDKRRRTLSWQELSTAHAHQWNEEGQPIRCDSPPNLSPSSRIQEIRLLMQACEP